MKICPELAMMHNARGFGQALNNSIYLHYLARMKYYTDVQDMNPAKYCPFILKLPNCSCSAQIGQ